jgi:hypothetical protein
MRQQLIKEYGELLPKATPEEWRRVRGEQEIIVRYEPEQAMATLPELLKAPGDRERLAALARALLGDERVQQRSEEQRAMIDRIGTTLGGKRVKGAPAAKKARGRASAPPARKAVARRRSRK